ncbi:MAG: NUDIX hydrolase, partial [Gammaproteobacteria bacterium]
MDTLQKLQGRIPAGEPSGAPEAGVLVGVIDSPSPRLIYTLRAASMNTHSGEVAFPGGKREQIDDDIWETALRESNEEIGLEIQTASKIGQLDRFTSRFG